MRSKHTDEMIFFLNLFDSNNQVLVKESRLLTIVVEVDEVVEVEVDVDVVVWKKNVKKPFKFDFLISNC